MGDTAKQLLLDYMESVDELKNKYHAAVQELRAAQQKIPEDRWQTDGSEINAKIEAKMTELGVQFKENMDRLTDKFAGRVSEMGDA